MFARLADNWVYVGFLAGLMLLALSPLVAGDWPLSTLLTFLTLPAYMLHQYEEHDADRFRRFVNEVVGGGCEVLTLTDVFWINIAGVWAVLVGVIWMTLRIEPGWGVTAAYLVLINGAALHHVAGAAFVVVLHVLIVAHVLRRRAVFARSERR